MKRYYALAMALALAASAAVASAQADEPTTKPAMVTTCSVRVRITWAQSGVSFSSKSIIDLLENPWHLYQVPAGEFDKHVANLEHISFTPLLSSGRAPSQQGYLLGEYCMGFSVPVKEADARKALETAVGHLRRLLLAEHKTYGNQIVRKVTYADRAQDDARMVLQKLRNDLAAAATRSAGADVAWKLENSRSTVFQLATQLRQANLQGATKAERLKALREQIAELVRDAAAVPKDEPAVAKLRELAEAQARELKGLRAKLGPQHRSVKALEGKLADLEAQLAKAFADQEARRDAALKSAGTPELIAKLKAEGIALMIDLREMQARATALKHELTRARVEEDGLVAQLKVRRKAEIEMERVEADLSLAMRRYEKSSIRSEELREQILSDLEWPTVTILKPSGEPTTRPKGDK